MEHMEHIDINGGLREEPQFWEILGNSKAISDIKKSILTVLDCDVPVVIYGKTGTGKELVARAIHYRGFRGKFPFCAINCASLPEHLLESMLFGHEKGAFTGASADHKGKFEYANNGTIFLDEISEMPLAMQAKLLRVMENQTFERVGGNRLIKTDVRIVAACNKDLLGEVNGNRFREDLYYRIAVFDISLPPLSERIEDVPVLVDCFIKKFSQLMGKNITKLDPRTLDKLTNYNWPGNIRQLQNSIRRAILLANNGPMLPEHFNFRELGDNDLRMLESLEDGMSKIEMLLKRGEVIPLSEVEEVFIRQALNCTQGNLSKAAEKLGISRSTIYRKMEEYGIVVGESDSNNI